MNAPISETSQKKLLRALRAYVIKEWACNREEQGVSLHSSLTFPLDCSFSLSTSLNYGTWGNLLCRRIQPVSLHSSLTFPLTALLASPRPLIVILGGTYCVGESNL